MRNEQQQQWLHKITFGSIIAERASNQADRFSHSWYNPCRARWPFERFASKFPLQEKNLPESGERKTVATFRHFKSRHRSSQPALANCGCVRWEFYACAEKETFLARDFRSFMTNEVRLIISESSTWPWISRSAVNYGESARRATGAASGAVWKSKLAQRDRSFTKDLWQWHDRCGSLTRFPRIPCGGYPHGFRRKPVGGAARGAGKVRSMAAVLVLSSPLPKLRRFLRSCWGQLGGHAGPWGKLAVGPDSPQELSGKFPRSSPSYSLEVLASLNRRRGLKAF